MLAGTVGLALPFPAMRLGVHCGGAGRRRLRNVSSHRPARHWQANHHAIRPSVGCSCRACARAEAPQRRPETWPIIGQKEVLRRVSKKEKELRTAAAKSGAAGESDWLPAAIVYVPEAAPVLHRNDIGVTAAVSAEEVAFSDLQASDQPLCDQAAVFSRGGKIVAVQGIDERQPARPPGPFHLRVDRPEQWKST